MSFCIVLVCCMSSLTSSLRGYILDIFGAWISTFSGSHCDLDVENCAFPSFNRVMEVHCSIRFSFLLSCLCWFFCRLFMMHSLDVSGFWVRCRNLKTWQFKSVGTELRFCHLHPLFHYTNVVILKTLWINVVHFISYWHVYDLNLQCIMCQV